MPKLFKRKKKKIESADSSLSGSDNHEHITKEETSTSDRDNMSLNKCSVENDVSDNHEHTTKDETSTSDRDNMSLNKCSEENHRQDNNMHRYKLSVAIDFGTTSCAMAYSYYNKQEEIHVFVDYSDGVETHGKIPTAILFDADKKFRSFGNLALSGFQDFADKDQHEEVYLFRNFKMCLYDEKKITADMAIDDVSGNEMQAMDVFVASFKYFKDTIIGDMQKRNEAAGIEERDIRWLITVPAIWNDRAKAFIRNAAEKAGYTWRSIEIALEPEAASIYCRKFALDEDKEHYNVSQMKQPKYLLIDIGGGTLDIAAHEVEEEGTIKEIYRASGNDLGGVKVDEKFEDLLRNLFSSDNLKNLKRENPDELVKIMQDFQNAKRKANLEDVEEVSISVATSMRLLQNYMKTLSIEETQGAYMTKKGKLFIPKDEIVKLIESVSKKIQSYVASLLSKNADLQSIDYIVMVGGFSNSKIVVNDIKNIAAKIPVIVPEHAELCVVKGAVMFGWKEDIIRSRKSRKTYGFGGGKHFIEGIHDEKRAYYDLTGKKLCENCFVKLISINDDVPYNHKVTSTSIHSHNEVDTSVIQLYATDDPNPMYYDVDGVTLIGIIRIPRPEGARGKKIHQEVYFGQTEIKVIVKDDYSGKTFEGNFSFLSNNLLKVVD